MCCTSDPQDFILQVEAYVLTSISPLAPPPAPGNYRSSLCFFKLAFLGSTYNLTPFSVCLSQTYPLSIVPSRSVHVL